VILKGKDLRLKISKHSEVKMPQDPADPSAYLTKDYLASPAHRFKNPGMAVLPQSFPFLFRHFPPDSVRFGGGRGSLFAILPLVHGCTAHAVRQDVCVRH